MLNLMEVLTDKDKELISTYLIQYSQAGKYYCGNDIFLKEWAKNKKGLFRLLGGQLRRSIDVCYEKDKRLLRTELSNLVSETEFIQQAVYRMLSDVRILGQDTYHALPTHGQVVCPIEENVSTDYVIKYKAPNAKKMLQINKGCSPVKALGKLVTYLYENFSNVREMFPNILNEYEEFRQKHSLILNDKQLKGKLVMSIHPLDFITMSNNSLGWKSCMRWEKNNKNASGCYHAGTIEMMNSNNVICCYLESKIPYEFHQNSETGEVFLWNNKRWRNLFIVTPEIICSGKAYPYQHKEMCYTILEELSKLAKSNKGWTYTFGIEEYKDMYNICNMEDMNRARSFIHYNNTKKHNIIFDTTGMYNDFLNDSYSDGDTKYYCIRNKVKRNVIIRYSGKALCTCCGDQYIFNDANTDCWEDYNERYDCLPEGDICPDCRDSIKSCNMCGQVNNARQIGYEILCYDCFKKQYGKCFDCGTIYSLNQLDERIYITIEKKDKEITYNREYASWTLLDYFSPYHLCPDCSDKVIKEKTYGEGTPIKIRYGGESTKYYGFPFDTFTEEQIKDHLIEGTPTFDDYYIMTTEIEAE